MANANKRQPFSLILKTSTTLSPLPLLLRQDQRHQINRDEHQDKKTHTHIVVSYDQYRYTCLILSVCLSLLIHPNNKLTLIDRIRTISFLHPSPNSPSSLTLFSSSHVFRMFYVPRKQYQKYSQSSLHLLLHPLIFRTTLILIISYSLFLFFLIIISSSL